MKKSYLKLLLTLFVLLLLAGCSSTPEEGEDAGAGAEVGSLEGDGGAFATGASGPGTWNGMSIDDPNSPLSNRTIYFEYDSSNVKAEYIDVLSAHGQYLAANPSVTMVLEGHCDERGTREYNLALGEQRAQRVKQLIMAEGASSMQVREISYGEEKPADFGQGEYAWSRNRRVEVIY